MMSKMESLQKKCIKWVLSEEFFNYGTYTVYLRKCHQVRLLPLVKRFDYNDLILLYKVLHKLIPLEFPTYLKFFEGNTRLRRCHLDHLSLISSVKPKSNVITDTNKNCALYKSFFYRVHLQWNLLPLEIRSIETLAKFKADILKYLWKSTLDDIAITDYIEEDLGDTCQ